MASWCFFFFRYPALGRSIRRGIVLLAFMRGVIRWAHLERMKERAREKRERHARKNHLERQASDRRFEKKGTVSMLGSFSHDRGVGQGISSEERRAHGAEGAGGGGFVGSGQNCLYGDHTVRHPETAHYEAAPTDELAKTQIVDPALTGDRPLHSLGLAAELYGGSDVGGGGDEGGGDGEGHDGGGDGVGGRGDETRGKGDGGEAREGENGQGLTQGSAAYVDRIARLEARVLAFATLVAQYTATCASTSQATDGIPAVA